MPERVAMTICVRRPDANATSRSASGLNGRQVANVSVRLSTVSGTTRCRRARRSGSRRMASSLDGVWTRSTKSDARGQRERRVAVGLLHEAERDDGVHEVGPFAHRILFRDGEVLPVDQLAFEQECRKRRQGALGNCTLVDLFTQDRCSFSWTCQSRVAGARPDPVKEWTKALKRQDFSLSSEVRPCAACGDLSASGTTVPACRIRTFDPAHKP